MMGGEPDSGSNSGQGSGETKQRKVNRGPRRSSAEKKVKTEEDVVRNRLIQAKYRQRVKERNEQLVAQYETACADLQRERQQLHDLVAENTALEAVLTLRSDWTAALEEASTPAASDVHAAAPTTSVLHSLIRPYLGGAASELRSASSSGLSSAGSMDVELEAHDREPQPLPAAAATAPAQQPTTAAPAAAAAANPGVGQLGLDPIMAAAEKIGSSLATAAAHDKGKPADASSYKFKAMEILQGMQVDPDVLERVKASTPEQFIRSWVDFYTKTMDMVAQYDLTKSETFMADIKLQMEQWGILLAIVLIHNPSNLRHLLGTQLGGKRREEEETQMWDDLLASLDLTKPQREQCLQQLGAYERQMELLRQHKEQALQMVRQGVIDPARPEQLESLGLSLRMAAYLQVWEGLGVLHAYPDMVFVAALQLMGAVTNDWTPLQRARLVAGCGPDFPDIFGVLHAIKRATIAISTPTATVTTNP